MMLASKLILMGNFGGNPRLPFHNCCISNVPGPQMPLYLAGAKLLYLTVVAPLTDGLTLFFAVISYDGKLIVTVTSAPEIVPDPAFMVTCLRESFAEMKQAAQKAAKETPMRKKAKETRRNGSVRTRARRATA